MIRLVYRPSYYFKHPITFIRHVYYDIYNGIRNIIRWTPVIYWTRDYDWTSLLHVMEMQLSIMGKGIQKRDRHVGAQRTARQCLVAAELCKRIRRDEYMPYSSDDWCPPIGPWHKRKSKEKFGTKYHKCYNEYMITQDIEMLATLLRKVRHWWD